MGAMNYQRVTTDSEFLIWTKENMNATKKIVAAVLLSAASAASFAAPMVEINTTEGKIVVDLNSKAAPVTVDNFLKYANSGFYNGTIFHRVINNFMIQGGGFDRNLHQKSTHAPIKLEDKNGLKNTVGTIAMARTNNPDSATSQFFINLKDNDFLNGTSTKDGYAVFGEVVTGMDVVRKIGRAPTGSKGFMDDVPVRPVIIESVKVLK